MKRISLLTFCLCLALCLSAQTNKKIKELEEKRGSLQKQISQTENLLKSTKKDVGSQLSTLETLNGQIAERKRYINVLGSDVESVDKELTSVSRQLNELQRNLEDKKGKYESSVQYMYKNKSIEEKLMFIFSAKNLGQIYRRMRYVREYATYQRLQGEEIMKKQEQISLKKQELTHVKLEKQKLLKARETEKEKLERQEKEKKTMLVGLQKRQKGLQNEISQKRKEASKLNAQIDRLIEAEIEKARKRAEEEARREAEKARQEAERTRKESASTNKSETTTTPETKKAAPMERFSMNKADRQLSGNFENNRGALPMPITGAYLIVSRYGQYSVEGLKNVKLDNKGIDIQGKPGAKARAIFDGEVSAVFQFNGLVGILIRHGNYISVYCNLSSASVQKGDKVKTKDPIGQIYADPSDGSRTILHFQLRKETAKLNPESWLNR